MENKKINWSFVIVVIALLMVFLILINNFNVRKLQDYIAVKRFSVAISNIVKEKNYKIRVLYYELMAQQKEINDLKNTLSETRNALEALSRKLAQPAPAPVVAPPVAPVPAAAPAPAAK